MHLPNYIIILIVLFIGIRLNYVHRGYQLYKRTSNFSFLRNELIYTAIYLGLIYGFIIFAQSDGLHF